MIASRSPDPGSQPRTIVVVGRRAPALAAAARLGLRVLLVDEAPLRRSDRGVVAGAVQLGFGGAEATWDALGRELAALVPAAVFATTERAVLPAAFLRRRLDLPGDDPETAVRCTDKLAMKRAVEAAGIPCARYLDAGERRSGSELVLRLGLPLVFKGRISSGGRQNRILRSRAEVPPRLRPGWMAESFVDGVEMSVESFVHRGEVLFANPTEYLVNRRANVVPATLPAATWAEIEALNRRALAALGVRDGLTHLELFRTPQGPVFGELAARPPGGHITELLELVYGFDPWEAWLRCGLGEPPPFPPALPEAPPRVGAAWVFHPGAGTVERVEGVAAAGALPGVVALVQRLRAGARVTERVGAGQETGYALVEGRDRDEAISRLIAVRDAVRVTLHPRVATAPRRARRPQSIG